MSYAAEELRQEAERELRQRRRVYPRLVEKGTLSQKLADEQIAKMQAIRDILAELEESERLL